MSEPNISPTFSQQLQLEDSTPATQEQHKVAKRDISQMSASSAFQQQGVQTPAVSAPPPIRASSLSSSSLTLKSITDSLKKQIDSWIDGKVKSFTHLQLKVASKEQTVSKYTSHITASSLPQDLQIKFNGYGNYPHSFPEQDREAFKEHEMILFNTALQSIVTFRQEKLQLDLANARNDLMVYSSEPHLTQLALKELPFLQSHAILLKETISHLLAMFTMNHSSQHSASVVNTPNAAPSANAASPPSNTNSNNGNINKDILTSMNKLNSLLEKHCKVLEQPSTTNHKQPQSVYNAKNGFGRGRGDTPQRGRRHHASSRTRRSPSNRRSLSRSSNHSRRSFNSTNNANHSRNHYNSNKSPSQGRRQKGRGYANPRRYSNNRYNQY